MESKKEFFSAKRIAILGTMTAVAYLLTLISFPIFPMAPFLMLDFSFAIMLLAGYMLGPLSAAIIVVAVNLLGAIGSSGGITGALANTVTATVFVVIPSLVYKYKKGLKWVILVLCACIILQCAVALPMNRYVTFYIFHIEDPAGLFAKVWWCILLFNLIKGVANGLITVLLYKRLKNLLGKFL
ncbi:MAG: ECF transporter S component [Clostridia bacterium]|nr:ECF transporter S component [Clostridia bacterium]